MESSMISKESEINFNTIVLAASNGDMSVVSCKDAKGREFDVLCVLASSIDNDGYAYVPFAVMLTPAIYPLMQKIKPPESLKGDWLWDE